VETVAQVIAFVGALVFLAHLFSGIFSRTRIPDAIFLILIGICVGPVLGLVSPSAFGEVGPVFTTITLIIILFEGGLALKLSMLRVALGGVLALAALSFFLTMGIVAGLAILFAGLEVLPAFILGAIVGSTSEAIIIPLIKQLKVTEETQTLLSVESSINDVLSIVITVALVQAYSSGSFQIWSVSGRLLASFFVALIIGFFGAFLWSAFLKRIHVLKNAMFTTPAFVFIIYGVVEILGFSGPIAALAFGITIGNIENLNLPIFRKTDKEPVGLNQVEKVFFSEIAFLLKTFFFIYLGISLELVTSWFLITALIFTLVAFGIRIPAIKLSIRKMFPAKDLSVMAVMIPKGLAAVVLASIPLQQGVTGGDIIKNITYGIIVFSILLTSILVILFEKTRLPDYFGKALKPWSFSSHSKNRAGMESNSGDTDVKTKK
jgi:cell volume regulation protein A